MDNRPISSWLIELESLVVRFSHLGINPDLQSLSPCIGRNSVLAYSAGMGSAPFGA
jgi:hypothetical protein